VHGVGREEKRWLGQSLKSFQSLGRIIGKLGLGSGSRFEARALASLRRLWPWAVYSKTSIGLARAPTQLPCLIAVEQRPHRFDMRLIGRSVPAEILPTCALVRTSEMIVWWSPSCGRMMFFSDRGNDLALKRMNGKLYPHPPLLFKACGRHLWVRALANNERPKAETELCMAPYWNCYDNGVCCTGSMRIPQEKSVAAIDLWEESFFQSEFTHASGVRKHVRFRGGFLAMWRSLAGQEAFPAKYLVKLPQTLAEFVRNDDDSYRDDNRHED